MIAIPDILNGLLEASMGFYAFKNLQAIRRDKQVKGVHWGTTAVADVWGFYNLFYYPWLHQYFSCVASLGIVTINTLWMYHAWKYGAFRKQKPIQTYPTQPLNPVSR